MGALILHHYPGSPFAEKVRAVLGFKKLEWKSVIQPTILPKPDFVTLTGGYRRIPALQIGADVWCDTALILKVLDRRHPTPPLYTDALAASELALSHFADQTFFSAAVGYAFQPAGLAELFPGASPADMAAFVQDRKGMERGHTSVRLSLAESQGVLMSMLPRLDAQLSDGRHYLTGTAARAVDFSVYHPLWFIERVQAFAPLFQPFPNLRGWLGRMKSLGHGHFERMSPAEAIEVARSSTPAMQPGRDLRSVDGVGVGDTVSVTATDYGLDAVTGVLVNADVDGFAVRRQDERAGEVVVHFPRIGYRITRAG